MTCRELLVLLEREEIQFDLHKHPPLFTVTQAHEHTAHLSGAHIKNLFLKDKKGRLWLIVALAETVVDLKYLAQGLQAPGLRFASPEILRQYLGVEPGSVTPLGVVHDVDHVVVVIIDKQLMAHSLVNVHPLTNEATITIALVDLLRIIEDRSNRIVITGLSAAASST